MSLKEYLTALAGKKVTVVGAGTSNRPLIALLAETDADVTVCDKSDASALGDFYKQYSEKGIKFSLGEHYLDNISADIIFRTPGVLPTVPALTKAAEEGAVLTSEMEVFFSLCPCRIIAVTGSDGKTTTTSIIAALMTNAGYNVWLGGNIGRPLLADVDRIRPEDVVVLELSSFQLHSMLCSPDAAVITNLSPNHLDVHRDFQDYIDAKKQIFLNQRPDARLVLNRDNDLTAACGSQARGEVYWFSRRGSVQQGVFLRADGMICAAEGGAETEILPTSELAVPGMHNVENMMAAFCAVWGRVPLDSMRRTARAFTGVAHRLETVRVLHGVTYINDSIASSPSRTMAGLACFLKKVILIAGGKDKGVPFDELGGAICRHVKRLYLTGMTAGVIRDAVLKAADYKPGEPEIFMIDDFADTVKAAAAGAEPGDTVLLSPASTSFDRFTNFEERGDTFRHIVEGLE